MILDLANPDQAALWRELAEDPARRLVCWDSKLFLVLQERAGVRPGQRPIDVMLMAFLTAPNAGDYSLKRWALDRLHLALEEEKGPRQGSLLPEEPGVRAEILCRRLDAVRRLHEALDPELDRLGLRRLYEEIDLPLVPVLAEMERTGIRVDRDRLKKMSAEMEQRLAGLTAGIYEAAGGIQHQFPKQLGEVLFEKLNLPSLKKTRKTGGYSTDQGCWRTWRKPTKSPPDPRIPPGGQAQVHLCRCDPGPDQSPDGRVHTSFNQTGTATGRCRVPIRTCKIFLFGRRWDA